MQIEILFFFFRFKGIFYFTVLPFSQHFILLQKPKQNTTFNLLCKRSFFCIIASKFAEDTDGRVQASPGQSWQNLLSEDLQFRGNMRDISTAQWLGSSLLCGLLSRKMAISGDTAHDCYPSTQECHVGRRMNRCLTSEASQLDACMLMDSPGPAS